MLGEHAQTATKECTSEPLPRDKGGKGGEGSEGGEGNKCNEGGELKTPLPDAAGTKIVNGVAVGIATGGGVGFLPYAPGSFGSLLGVALFFALFSYEAFAYLAVLLLLTPLGVWASGRAERIFESQDDGRIVIDEVVGQLITLLPLLLVRGLDRLPQGVFFSLVVTGFVAFRVLDIAKPGWIRRVELNTHGGFGVMADDLVAGLFGTLVLAVATFGMLSWMGMGAR